jgi:hypothetical protein
MKNQKVFLSSPVCQEDISTTDGGHTKAVSLYPENGSGEIFVRVVSFGDHTDFDVLVKPGKQYIVHVEQVEDAPPPFKRKP